MTNFMILFLLVRMACMDITLGQEDTLPEYVVSECYGDIFSFDCGKGHKIRINRDFFGYSHADQCHYNRGDCIMSNPKSNSLIHRYCTGRVECTYYLVERRGCDGYFSNYQQVEYQCVPDSMITNVCSDVEYETESTYIATPNFPGNYPAGLNCNCVVSSSSGDERVRMEIVYMAVKFHNPCKDWVKIGRRKICGTRIDMYSGRRIPIGFYSDENDSHSGFWFHFQSSKQGSKIHVRCGDKVNSTKPLTAKKKFKLPTTTVSTTTSTTSTTTTTTTTTSTPATTTSTTTSKPATVRQINNDNNMLGAASTNSSVLSKVPHHGENPGIKHSRDPRQRGRTWTDDQGRTFRLRPAKDGQRQRGNVFAQRKRPRTRLPVPKEWLASRSPHRAGGKQLFPRPNPERKKHEKLDDFSSERHRNSDIVHQMGEMIVPSILETSTASSTTEEASTFTAPAAISATPTASSPLTSQTPVLAEISNVAVATPAEGETILSSDLARQLTEWWNDFDTEAEPELPGIPSVGIPSGASPVTITAAPNLDAPILDVPVETSAPWIDDLVESTIKDIIRSTAESTEEGLDKVDGFGPGQYLPEEGEKPRVVNDITKYPEDVFHLSSISNLLKSPEVTENPMIQRPRQNPINHPRTNTLPPIRATLTLNSRERTNHRVRPTLPSTQETMNHKMRRKNIINHKVIPDVDDDEQYTNHKTPVWEDLLPTENEYDTEWSQTYDSRENISTKSEEELIVLVDDNPLLPKDRLLSLGFIILCIAVIVGIVFLTLAVFAFCMKRRYPGVCNEETQTTNVPRSISGESDTSGTGLIITSPQRKRSFHKGLKAHAAACSVATTTGNSYQEGTGHQSQYTCDGKADKCVQIDLDQADSPEEDCESDDTYLVPSQAWRPRADSVNSVAGTNNSKGVQAKPAAIRGEAKTRTQLKRRKVFKKVSRDGSLSSEFRSTHLDDDMDSGDDASMDTTKTDKSCEPKPRVPPKPTGPKPKRNIWSVPTILPSQQPDSPQTQAHRGSIASLSELAEVTISPQHTTKGSPITTPLSSSPDNSEVRFSLDDSLSDTDWETKSAISL